MERCDFNESIQSLKYATGLGVEKPSESRF